MGLYLGIEANRLRYFTSTGSMVPTPEEAAIAAQQEAQHEKQRSEQLSAHLRSLGIDPERL